MNEVLQDTTKACCSGVAPKASPLASGKVYPSTTAVGLEVVGEVRVRPAVRAAVNRSHR